MEVGGEEEIQGLQARIAKLLKVPCELFVLVFDGKILEQATRFVPHHSER